MTITVDLEAHIGDNRFWMEGDITLGSPMIPPSLKGPGEPVEHPVVEITEVRLLNPEEGEVGSIEFFGDYLIIDGEPFNDIVENKLIDEWEKDGGQ